MKWLFATLIILTNNFFAFGEDENLRSIHVKKTVEGMKVDGILNENAWQVASKADQFWQQYPFDTSHAVTRTEVMITYDDNNLYIGAVCYDDIPGEYYPLVRDALPFHGTIVVLSGEEHKNLDTCNHIWARMTALEMDRHSILIIIGGGVLGDMGGFCAATYKRGIDFILIPTTLLSQVDASIGGKPGVDFQHFKNHIGVFKTPVLTLLHSGFLRTLPEAEKRSGFAEVIKHTLIADAAEWEQLRNRKFDDQPWDMLLEHSVKVKLNVVTEDPYEKTRRKTLNAGHTIGHAIETYLLQADRKGAAMSGALATSEFTRKAIAAFEKR